MFRSWLWCVSWEGQQRRPLFWNYQLDETKPVSLGFRYWLADSARLVIKSRASFPTFIASRIFHRSAVLSKDFAVSEISDIERSGIGDGFGFGFEKEFLLYPLQ